MLNNTIVSQEHVSDEMAHSVLRNTTVWGKGLFVEQITLKLYPLSEQTSVL